MQHVENGNQNFVATIGANKWTWCTRYKNDAGGEQQ
jgi:hypothetical protein